MHVARLAQPRRAICAALIASALALTVALGSSAPSARAEEGAAGPTPTASGERAAPSRAAEDKPEPGAPAKPKPAQPNAAQAFGVVAPSPSEAQAEPDTLAEQRQKLYARMQRELELSPEHMERVRRVFEASTILGQGNPKLSVHPIGRAECTAALATHPLQSGDEVCGAPNMAALYDRQGDTSETASVCIDQFEFPNIPCEYPVVHVSAREAAQLCEVVGKRLCDAHEWEGACAGALRPPEQEYAWGQDRKAMRRIHNAARQRVWAYGPEKNHARCATTSAKTPGCPGGGYHACGSNTFPAGAFPECVSPFGVYDLHGNAAEHMNLPRSPAELTSAGGSGVTEMKGSWFIFSRYEAHEDDCRWRAPDWHGSRVMDPRSHGNYHLGFRCCKSVQQAPAASAP